MNQHVCESDNVAYLYVHIVIVWVDSQQHGLFSNNGMWLAKMFCCCRLCVRFPLVSVLADSSWLWVSYARPLKWQARSILPGINLKRCQKVTGCKHLDDWLQCSPVSLHYLNLPPPASIHHVLFSASTGHLHGHQDDSIRGLQTLQWQRIRPINGIK